VSHANARLTVHGRAELVRRVVHLGRPVAHVVIELNVSRATGYKWLARWRAEGPAGLVDRPSWAHRLPGKTPAALEAEVLALRAARKLGPARIGPLVGLAPSTVHAVLRRHGMHRLAWLDRPTGQLVRRYERARPGELLHVDVKKLGRIPDGRAGHRIHASRALQRSPRKRDAAGRDRRLVGWEYVHVCIDDATRLAYVEVLADEKAITAVGFLRRAIAFYASHGITVQAVMSDNGACYRSTIHAFACRALGIRHLRTRPYRPRTNGKAERFIRTLIAGWAYGAIYGSSRERAAALDGWLWTYNHRRPHGALSHKPPIARLNELNNLAGSYI
jgi:transposase InsO family protein